MNNIITTLIFFIPFFAISQSQHFDQRNAIRTSPVEFGKAEFQLGYEYYWPNRTTSLLILPSIILEDRPQQVMEGFQLESQVRFYLSHLRSDERNVFLGFHNVGFYTGLYGKYINYHEEYDYTWWDNASNDSYTQRFEKSVNAGEGGILIGLQIDVTKRILIDFFVGGGIRYPKFTDTKNEVVTTEDYYQDVSVFDPEYKGVKPKIGFQLGFLF